MACCAVRHRSCPDPVFEKHQACRHHQMWKAPPGNKGHHLRKEETACRVRQISHAQRSSSLQRSAECKEDLMCTDHSVCNSQQSCQAQQMRKHHPLCKGHLMCKGQHMRTDQPVCTGRHLYRDLPACSHRQMCKVLTVCKGPWVSMYMVCGLSKAHLVCRDCPLFKAHPHLKDLLNLCGAILIS